MADLTYANVTISFLLKDMWRKQRANTVQISYGNGALTYPANGVPLGATVAGALKRLGLGRWCDLELLQVPKDGYLYLFDQTLFTIRKFQTASHTPTGTAAGQVFTGAELATHQHNLTDGSLIYPWSPGGGDIKGSTAPAGTEENADAASGPVNAALIGAEQTFTAMAGTKAITLQPDVARNAIVVVHNDSGGPLDLYEGVTTFTVTGLFRGAAQTEAITITSTAGNKSVADTKFRYKAGVKPFDSISSATYVNGAAGGLKCSIAPGSLLGYPVDSDTGAEADFLKVTVNAANYVVTGKVNVTNKTLNVGTIADADDIGALYLIDFDQGPTALVTAGTPAGTNAASALTIALVAAGVLSEVPGAHAPAATVIRARAVGI